MSQQLFLAARVAIGYCTAGQGDGAMQINWLITTALALVLSTEVTKENIYTTTIVSITLYHC